MGRQACAHAVTLCDTEPREEERAWVLTKLQPWRRATHVCIHVRTHAHTCVVPWWAGLVRSGQVDTLTGPQPLSPRRQWPGHAGASPAEGTAGQRGAHTAFCFPRELARPARAHFLLEAVRGPRRATTSRGQKGLSWPRHNFISSGP